MSLDAYQWAWRQQVKPAMKIILLALADRADEKHQCFPSIDRLEHDTGLNRKTIMSSLKKLSSDDIGLVKIQKGKSAKGQFLRNQYTLIGVKNRHEPEPKNGTRQAENPDTENGTRQAEKPQPKNGTRNTPDPCPKNGQTHVPKTDKTMSQKRDTNLPVNLPIEPKEKINKKKFVEPTVEEVRIYAKSRDRPDLAQKFFDYFDAGDWYDSTGAKVKNWKQKFITWETRNERNENRSTNHRAESNHARVGRILQEQLREAT